MTESGSTEVHVARPSEVQVTLNMLGEDPAEVAAPASAPAPSGLATSDDNGTTQASGDGDEVGEGTGAGGNEPADTQVRDVAQLIKRLFVEHWKFRWGVAGTAVATNTVVFWRTSGTLTGQSPVLLWAGAVLWWLRTVIHLTQRGARDRAVRLCIFLEVFAAILWGLNLASLGWAPPLPIILPLRITLLVAIICAGAEFLHVLGAPDNGGLDFGGKKFWEKEPLRHWAQTVGSGMGSLRALAGDGGASMTYRTSLACAAAALVLPLVGLETGQPHTPDTHQGARSGASPQVGVRPGVNRPTASASSAGGSSPPASSPAEPASPPSSPAVSQAPAGLTYDELCNPTYDPAKEPGAGAEDWAASALHDLFLGGEDADGAGGYIAGCAGETQTARDAQGTTQYLIGTLNGHLMSVAIDSRECGAALLLDNVATVALGWLEHGRTVCASERHAVGKGNVQLLHTVAGDTVMVRDRREQAPHVAQPYWALDQYEANAWLTAMTAAGHWLWPQRITGGLSLRAANGKVDPARIKGAGTRTTLQIQNRLRPVRTVPINWERFAGLALSA